MASPVSTIPWRNAAILSYGFRPFFLAAALWAGLCVAVWVAWLRGAAALPSALPPLAWHVHELLFGMVVAVMAGFLLTAVPSWTKRPPLTGLPLAALFGLWAAGRVAIALSELTGLAPALVVALLFPIALITWIGREIAAAGNRRNLPVVALLAIFAVGQGFFGLEVVRDGTATHGHRIAIATALMLVMLIGGRVIPAFSTNWLKQNGVWPLPAPFGRFDMAALLVAAAALVGWAAGSEVGGALLASLLVGAGVIHGVRLWRWRPLTAVRAPLVAALHCAYAFIPLGFLFAGAGLFMDRPNVAHAAVHIWTMGAIALMMLAIMTRASRGHTGRPLSAPATTVGLYAALVLAVVARAAATLEPSAMGAILLLAAAGWVTAFFGFAVLYGPMLVSPRENVA